MSEALRGAVAYHEIAKSVYLNEVNVPETAPELLDWQKDAFLFLRKAEISLETQTAESMDEFKEWRIYEVPDTGQLEIDTVTKARLVMWDDDRYLYGGVKLHMGIAVRTDGCEIQTINELPYTVRTSANDSMALDHRVTCVSLGSKAIGQSLTLSENHEANRIAMQVRTGTDRILHTFDTLETFWNDIGPFLND